MDPEPEGNEPEQHRVSSDDRARPKRRERFRPGIAEREKKRKAFFGLVFLAAGSLVVGTVYFIIHFYEKPADDLVIEVTAVPGLALNDWVAESKQRAETINRGGRRYVNEWFVAYEGKVANGGGEAKKVPGLRIDVLNRAGKVAGRRDLYVGVLEPGEARSYSGVCRIQDSGNRPARLRISISETEVTKDLADLQKRMDDLERRLMGGR